MKEKPKRNSDYLPRFTPSQELTEDLFEKQVLGQKFPLRNKAILELVYSSGLRRTEVRALNLSDIGGDFLHITGKGGKERVVPFGERTKETVLEYLKKERPNLVKKNPNESALFVSLQGKRISPGTYSQIIVPKHVHKGLTFHSFRHACATHMLENGASSMHLKELLGHEKLSTTQVYTRLSVEDLRKVLEKYHPRG